MHCPCGLPFSSKRTMYQCILGTNYMCASRGVHQQPYRWGCVCSERNKAKSSEMLEVCPFVVRHAEEQRARAGAAHALPAEDHKATTSPSPPARRLVLPQYAGGPVLPYESSCISEPAERTEAAAAFMPSDCMPGVEGMRSIAADDRIRRNCRSSQV